MKPVHIILLTGCLIILGVDAFGSIASRRYSFNYARLAPLSFIIYMVIGYIGIHEADQTTSIILASVVGFFDATVGWKVSMLLNANVAELNKKPSVSGWVSTTIFVTLLAAICGLVGSEVFRLIS